MGQITIVAEIGVNHNADMDIAAKMIAAAKNAGADVAKFQTAKPEQLISRFAPKADYQKRNTASGESQLEMVKKLVLPFGDFIVLKQMCDKIGIAFCSTPFDLESVDFLKTLDMPFWKIPSGEITNLPYLIKIAKTAKPAVVSTGMCTMGEARDAVSVLKSNGAGEITALHCNTEYPTPYEDANLRAMLRMRDELDVKVGYSDHTLGIEVPIAAAALGAAVIEKHFTLDRNMEGPDHKASLEPDELAAMVKAVRNIELALGSGEKMPSPSEKKNMAIARKSIVARRGIKAGEALTEENITAKRPGNGISPMRWFEVLGTEAIRDFEEDELIEL
jgi:N,N'-diacetyllegionaminate synthase